VNLILPYLIEQLAAEHHRRAALRRAPT